MSSTDSEPPSTKDVSGTVNCVWVLSGSPEPRLPSTFDWITPPDRVVAADGGSALLEALNLKPDIAIGDFDSIDPALLDRLRKLSGVDIRQYDHRAKSETDTELAVLAALEWQPRQVFVFGAIGGRLDHSLANVLMLAHPALAEYDVRIVEGDQELFLAHAGRWTVVHGDIGDTISVLPLKGDALGVSNEGFEYPLHGETIPFGTSRGISNVLVASEGRIWVEDGLLLVVVKREA